MEFLIPACQPSSGLATEWRAFVADEIHLTMEDNRTVTDMSGRCVRRRPSRQRRA